jgi:outer membrane protein assembly factor BamB
MKKQIGFLLVLIATNFFIFSSCNKTDTTPAPKTKTQLISQAVWKFQSASASGTDITNNPAIACIKDDIITFVSAGTGNISDGAIVCVPTTTGNFTWSFQNSESTLVMSTNLLPGGSGTFTIVTLTETTLTISQNVLIPPLLTPIPVTAVYVH